MLTNLDAASAQNGAVTEQGPGRNRKPRRQGRIEPAPFVPHRPTLGQRLYAPARRVLDFALAAALLVALGGLTLGAARRRRAG